MSKVTAAVLEGFVTSLLLKSFDDPAPVADFHREVWDYVCSDTRQVAIAAPRGHAKSTVITHAYILAECLFREQSYVIIVSDTVSQSVQFLGDIKKELIENQDLRSLFNVKGLIKDTEDDLICELEDGHLFRIQAKGAEQKLRGLKWKGRRPGLVVGDDMENDEIVMNRDRRTKFKRWFYGALLPCMSDKGKIRIVGTILHLDSLLENLMPSSLLRTISNGSKKLIQEDLKEYTNAKVPWKSIKYRAHTDDFKSILWPEKKSVEEFKASREDYARQGLSDVYSQEMLNIPLDEPITFFKKQDFIAMRDMARKVSLVYYITCDLAVSQKQRADYSCFTVAGMDENGQLYLINVIKERLDALQIVQSMLYLQKLYKPILFGIEAGTIQNAIGPYLNAEMLSKGVYLSTVLLKPTGDKLTRARSIQARMRASGCKFDKDADWYDGFESELMRFPRDKHDDQVDAWAYMGLMLDKMHEAPTQDQMYEEEYQEFKAQYASDGDAGRNLTTGY